MVFTRNAFLFAAIAGVCCLSLGAGAEQKPADIEARPKIDVVFALDTTSSMSGLIQGAKTKVWSIVNQIASGKPTPEIRVGLVAYRDRGDDYITQVTDLTSDLDAMYATLMGFAAEGGGDTPESVNQALADAVNKVSWRQGGKVLRIVFLVGDAPPHMDYTDDVKYPETCRQAKKKGIIINTVRCGSDSQTEAEWQKIAHLAEGSYLSIAQSGGVAEVRTPYDEEIAKVDRDMRDTVVFYVRGEERKRAVGAMKMAESTMAAAPAEARAERAAYAAKAGSGPAGVYARSDLVKAVEDKSVSVDKLGNADLPDEIKNMPKAERETFLIKKAEQRHALEKKLAELNQYRSAFIADTMKRANNKDGFDNNVIELVREKAKKIGVSY